MGQTEIGSRLLGSAGQFEHDHRSATASVNFITVHDGFTLADVVSYAGKHNEANGTGTTPSSGRSAPSCGEPRVTPPVRR